MGDAVKVEVLLFALLRERAGTASLTVEVPAPTSVRGIWEATVAAHPAIAATESSVRAALNERYSDWDAPVHDADTVAFLPPVSGGSGGTVERPRVYAMVTSEPLNAGLAEDLVRAPADGAVCTFTGIVRDNSDGREVGALEYEAYVGMAEGEMRRIAEEARERFGVGGVAVMHRMGRLNVGEASVVVAVSSPHRGESFDACRHVIDEVKARAPIWKREHGPDGVTWAQDGAPESASATPPAELPRPDPLELPSGPTVG